MPLTLDRITHKKLVLVKQIYQRAVVDAAGSLSTTNRILTVIEFDLAIETVLKTIIGALESTKPPERHFPELIKQANSLLKQANLGTVPDEVHIRHIHDIRNNAQHQAIYPNETDVSDCRTYTRDFLNTVVKQVWDIPFENISLADLIEDAEVKQMMLDAYAKYDQQAYSEAVDLASEAFDKTLEYVSGSVIGHFPAHIHGIVVSDALSEGKGEKLMHDSRESRHEVELLNAIKRMRQTILYLALEMNFSESVRYWQIVGYTNFTLDEKHHRYEGKANIDKNDAEFVLSYCTNTIVRIEGRVGSLKKPLGTTWYWSGIH